MVALALRTDETARASLRPAALLEEMDALARAVEDAALTTDTQRTLARLLRQVALLDGLVHARLSPTEYQDYQRLRSSLTADSLWQSLSSITSYQLPVTKRGLEQLIASLPAHEHFYALAHQRDAALVRNTLALLAQNLGPETRAPSPEPRVAVLIAGGFHTPGITVALKAQHIAYAVITPRVEQARDSSRYDAGLANTLPPLSEVLAQVQRASLQIPLAINPKSPPTTVVLKTSQPPTGSAQDQTVTFPTKRAAVFFYWAIAQFTALTGWGQRLLSWFADYLAKHPETIVYGLALTYVGGKLVLSAMGRDVTIDDSTAPLLAMAVMPPIGPSSDTPFASDDQNVKQLGNQLFDAYLQDQTPEAAQRLAQAYHAHGESVLMGMRDGMLRAASHHVPAIQSLRSYYPDE